MDLARRRLPARDEQGFTLIELLVVILIIAILAAIAIPVFLNQREKGWIAQQQQTLKDAAIAGESYAGSNNGSYLGLDEADLIANGWQRPSYVSQVHVAVHGGGTRWCIRTRHAQLRAGVTDWRTATYKSWEGVPTQDNNC